MVLAVCVGSYVFGSIAAREVVQHQHRIGGVDGFPGAGNADLLHLVGAVTQTGGVDHVQRHALDLYGLLHLVAGGARNGVTMASSAPASALSSELCPRWAGPQSPPGCLRAAGLLAGGAGAPGPVRIAVLQLPGGIGFAQKVDFFFRKVQRGLDQHAQVDEGIAQRVIRG